MTKKTKALLECLEMHGLGRCPLQLVQVIQEPREDRASKASLEMDLLGVVAHAFNPRQGQGMSFEFYVVSSRPANAI